jgi:hypothetical protein
MELAQVLCSYGDWGLTQGINYNDAIIVDNLSQHSDDCKKKEEDNDAIEMQLVNKLLYRKVCGWRQNQLRHQNIISPSSNGRQIRKVSVSFLKKDNVRGKGKSFNVVYNVASEARRGIAMIGRQTFQVIGRNGVGVKCSVGIGSFRHR